MEFRNDDQLRSYLRKESKKLNISIQNVYNTFFSRYLLEKLSEINHGELFVKGSFVEFIHATRLYRPITDLDLASLCNTDKAIKYLLSNIYDSNSTISFELSKLPTMSSTGMNQFSLLCQIGKMNHPLNVDLEPNYTRIMELGYKKVPAIFSGDKVFYINCPSYEEYLAEKLCITAEYNKPNAFNPQVINSRVKDFYDIYKLHDGEFDLEKLTYYFGKMIEKRNRISKNDVSTDHLNRQFVLMHQPLWDKAKISYEFLDSDIRFIDAVIYTKDLLDYNINVLKKSNYFR